MRQSISLLAAICLALVFFVSAPPAGAGNREAGQRLHSVRDILEKDVVSPRGTLLGIVQDVMVNQNGEITFLVLSRGSAFGVVGPYHPIPWRVANPRLQGRKIRIELDERAIEKAPSIEMKAWSSSVFTPAFTERLQTYYQQVEKP